MINELNEMLNFRNNTKSSNRGNQHIYQNSAKI